MPLGNIAANLTGSLARLLGPTVTYRRGVDSISDVPVVKGNTLATFDDGRGVNIDLRINDYLIDSVYLDFGLGKVEPEAGDIIEEVIDGVVHQFEVMPVAGQKEWRWSDRAQNTYRIHTKFIGTV